MLRLVLNYDKKKGERKKIQQEKKYYIKGMNNSWNIISIFMKSLWQKQLQIQCIIHYMR